MTATLPEPRRLPPGPTGSACDDPSAPARAAERRWRVAGAVLLAALAALMLGTFLQYGVTWDEEFQAMYGEVVLRWYTTLFHDRSALVDYAHLHGAVDHLYGAAFDLVAQAATRISPLGPYETRHLVNVLAALAGVVGTYRLGALLGGARSGVLAAGLLAATPAYYGHAFNNPKDVPFAALHAWVLVLALEAAVALPRVPWRRVVALGAVTGLALGVRVGGVFVIGYTAAAWAATLLPHARDAGFARSALAPAAGRLAAVGVVAWAVLLLSWPAAQLSPLARPLEALRELGGTGTVVPVLFEGRTVLSTMLPRSYLPTWLAVTLPETWFVALAAGLAAAASALLRGTWPRPRSIPMAVLGVAVLFPTSFAVLTRPNMFDAWRHFLFVGPPLAALAAHGFARVAFDASWPRVLRVSVLCAACAALALVLADMARLHPYQTVYFNRLIAGGLPGAEGRFETDYWGATHREGIEWLLANASPGDPGRPVRVASCSQAFLTEYPLSRSARAAAFRNVEMNEEPDVVLATTRFGCARRLAEGGWQPLHAVERMGVPLLFVLRSPGR